MPIAELIWFILSFTEFSSSLSWCFHYVFEQREKWSFSQNSTACNSVLYCRFSIALTSSHSTSLVPSQLTQDLCFSVKKIFSAGQVVITWVSSGERLFSFQHTKTQSWTCENRHIFMVHVWNINNFIMLSLGMEHTQTLEKPKQYFLHTGHHSWSIPISESP